LRLLVIYLDLTPEANGASPFVQNFATKSTNPYNTSNFSPYSTTCSAITRIRSLHSSAKSH